MTVQVFVARGFGVHTAWDDFPCWWCDGGIRLGERFLMAAAALPYCTTCAVVSNILSRLGLYPDEAERVEVSEWWRELLAIPARRAG